MDTISAATLFTIWERGRPLSPTGRSRVMLHALGIGDAALGQLTVGQRDGLLMDLRGRVFGTQVASVADCPACSERMDVTFDLRDVWTPAGSGSIEPIGIEADGYTIRARPPTVADLLWLDDCDPGVDRRSALLGRCVVDAILGDIPVSSGELPEPVVARIAAALSEADPHAEILLTLACAACRHSWSVLFDIVSYFWQELETWVWRMARDVDTLAARYGWSETEILAMNPNRRSLYLEMVRA